MPMKPEHTGSSLGGVDLHSFAGRGARRGRAKHIWSAGFGLSIACALLTHVYAVYLLVPFAVVELYSLLKTRRLNWGVIGMMAIAFMSVTFAIYLPLARTYKAAVPPTFFPGSHDLFQRFLVNVVGPAIIVLLLSLFLAVIDAIRRSPRATLTVGIPGREVVLAAGFICIPLVGLIGSKVSHGPLLRSIFPFREHRRVCDFCLAFASTTGLVGSWTAKVLATCMFVLMVADLGTTAYFSTVNRIMLFEPSTGLRLEHDAI